MADFSAGQKKKVLLARSLCEPSHLLVWDEPLNYVDVLSRMQIEDLLLGIPADDRLCGARPRLLRSRRDKGRDALTA
ncbi:MAG: ATP-binding cassette domain-containing protein [Acutalibacteraceae bacterium]